ncbi:MAG: penicillin acylase family protein [Planctomycetia bacterium]|nr:penicillin acylase family protein [Planctomycetia bacterium]
MKRTFSLTLLGMTIAVLGLSLQETSKAYADKSADKSAESRWAKLASQVTIARDAYGVPHVNGKTDAATVFGFVYAQAEDYFWQIEDNYLRALGRASEVYGEKSLPDDLLNRALELTTISKKEYELSSPKTKEMIQASADGLNYFLATHPNVKPRVITQFEPWHALAFRRFALYQLFIYNKSGLRSVDVLQALKSFQPAKASNLELKPEVMAAIEAEQSEAALHATHVGSNMWAIRPEKSETGKPMLFINPHQPFFGAGQWYEGHLMSDEGWNLLGACFFGSPCPTIGYNGHIAWSHTVNDPDIVDLYQITLKPDQPDHYQYGDGSKPIQFWEDTVSVKTGTGVTQQKFRFAKTHHGPIVASKNNKLLAVRLAKFESSGGLEEWYNMGKAKSVAEFKEAMKPCEIPMFNAMVADNAGNIFYVYNGAIPKRSLKFDWSKPVDGSNPETEWQGYHAFEELPQLENPKCGFLQNCNQQPLTTTPIASELAAGEVDENPKSNQFPPYMIRERDRDNGRARISRRILKSTNKFDFESWAKAGFNTKVIEAETRVPEVIKEWETLLKNEPERANKLKDAIDQLKQWNFTSTIDSVPMTLFALTYQRAMQMVQKGDMLNSPRIRALESTISELTRNFGTWKVAWGEINRLQRIHGSEIDGQGKGAFRDDKPSLPVAGSPGTFGIVFNFYALPQEGQKRNYGVAGHSYVSVVELSEAPKARTVLQFGQSGDPESPHWFDQAPLYARGEFKHSCYSHQDIAHHCKRPYHPGGVSEQNGQGK